MASVGNEGDYRNIYNDLAETDSFVLSSSLFMQNYLDYTPVNLTQIASKLYDYDPAVEYNEPEPEPEPIPEPVPEPDPEPVPEPEPTPEPDPEPELEPPISQPVTIHIPTPSQCGAGLSGGYISNSTAKDQNGRYLSYLSTVKFKSTSGQTSTFIHRCLKDSLQKMLDEYNTQVAAANKIGGWGWRSQTKQIELRQKHCGTSEYDVWEKPASECSPPTARPGYSSHQDGLAIDFFCLNNLLNKTNCEGFFSWLDCNAAQYGLINLPSEPWHWYYPIKKPSKIDEKLTAGC